MKDDVERVLLLTLYTPTIEKNAKRLSEQIEEIIKQQKADIAHHCYRSKLEVSVYPEIDPPLNISGIKSIAIDVTSTKYIDGDMDNLIRLMEYVKQREIKTIFIEGKDSVVSKLLTQPFEGGTIYHIRMIDGHLMIFRRQNHKTVKVHTSKFPLTP